VSKAVYGLYRIIGGLKGKTATEAEEKAKMREITMNAIPVIPKRIVSRPTDKSRVVPLMQAEENIGFS
jgi:hypothetical protein